MPCASGGPTMSICTQYSLHTQTEAFRHGPRVHRSYERERVDKHKRLPGLLQTQVAACLGERLPKALDELHDLRLPLRIAAAVGVDRPAADDSGQAEADAPSCYLACTGLDHIPAMGVLWVSV